MAKCIKPAVLGGLAVLLPLLASTMWAQDTTETRRLRTELSKLRTELAQYQDEVDSQVTGLRDSARLARAGTNRFVITGYGVAAYTAEKDGPSRFTSEVSPILLWQLNERILFQAETEFEMEEELETNVEYAQVSYLATDFLNIGAGKFLTPFNIFSQRLHPAWINKLPNSPLVFGHDGLVPGSGVGAFVRGGVPVGLVRASYALYGMNAPAVMTMGEEAGQIEPQDESDERAYGGRIGLFFLRPGIEVGVSYQKSDAAKLTGFDASLSRQIAPLRGNVDARFEGVAFDGVNGPFHPEPDAMEDQFFENNRRDGGYGQLAYRPSLVASRIVRNVELVGRYEWLNRPDWQGGEMGNDTKRYTAGVNYWLTPSMQIKLGLQRTTNTIGSNTKSFLVQAATGF